MNGRFTPVNYSKVRFENKVKAVKDQMKNLNKDSDDFIYSANRDFLFPRRELEKVKSAYNGLKFFDETYNEETGKMEGGYYPDTEKYQRDEDGDLMYSSETGKPMLEEGFIKQQIRKIPGRIKDLVLPGAPKTGLQSKIVTPPLPKTPMPNIQLSQQQNVDPITGLTATQDRLLSPSDKAYYRNKNRTA